MSKSVLHQILDRGGFSPVTKSKYAPVIDRWIDFAGTDPNGWTRDKAQEFYDSLIEGGLAVQSANVYIASLRYVSRWYAAKTPGGIDFAVVQRQRGTKGTKKRQRQEGDEGLISPEGAKALIDTCRGLSPIDLRDLAFIVCALETGMRRMSFRGMMFENISETKGYPIATVPIKGPGGEETFPVPLSDTAWLALSAWLDWLRTRKLRSGPVFRRLTPRLVRGTERTFEPGDVLSLTGINEIAEARSKAASIEHVNPHMFRHTFITWRQRLAGLTPLEISAITGHKVSIVAVEGIHMRIGDMRTYFHHDVNRIRNTTPTWLTEHVREVLRG
jgi:integrase